MVVRIVLFLLTWILFVASSAAQTVIEGAVHDAAGQAIAKATVVLQREGAGEVGRTATDPKGIFRFSTVDSGAYTLSTSAAGFYDSNYNFVARARQPLNITIALTPKLALQQRVEVESSYRSIDPEKTGSSQTITRQELEHLPDTAAENTSSLVSNFMPGASQSHDNFINVRGNEFSLHEFINGVSFLDNTQTQFSPGVSPQIFETVDLVTGGFTPEYGNRFGGILDITTRSGRTMNGHGDINYRGATLDNHDLNGDFGGQAGKLGYYFFGDGFTSGRYMDPPEPEELHDFGKGLRGAAQFDGQHGRDTFKLLLMGSGADFEQPNLSEDQEAGRDADRHLRQQTAILSWGHQFSENTVLSSSLYQRLGSDHILPTSDPETPLSIGSRSTLSLGVKSDLIHLWRGHVIKAGVDLTRLRELESFFIDGRGDPDVFPIDFREGLRGGQAGLYVQDHFSPFRNFVVDAGLRYDYFDLIDTQAQVSPRVGFAYHSARTRTVLRAAYNRLMSPPPIEYSLLASFIGNNAPDPDQRVGNVRAYTQNYFEAGIAQELAPQVSMEITAWTHAGHNSFENHEISISRLFLPINFHTARANGLDFVLNARNLERLGITGRLQYAAQRTFFYGPVSGGFAGDEPLAPGERIMPAFDQTHTGTGAIFYRHPWRNWWSSAMMRYGSGTIVERGPRLPQHLTADLGSGFTLWNAEPRRLDLEFDVTNVSDSRYKIAKESEEIPIQFAPSRTVGGSLKFHF